MSACLHITTETANLLRALKAGGADVTCCASNPLSTQDDVAAALVRNTTFRLRDSRRGSRHLLQPSARRARSPSDITMDDGADLVSLLHTDFKEQAAEVRATMEETTTGVIRLRAMEQDGALRIPVVAVNDAQTKYLFDNRYGTGQSTRRGDRPRDRSVGGRFDLRGGGLRMVRARRRIARAWPRRQRVVVTEVNPIRALEAAMDGHRVMQMADAAKVGDVFVTVTGDRESFAPSTSS